MSSHDSTFGSRVTEGSTTRGASPITKGAQPRTPIPSSPGTPPSGGSGSAQSSQGSR